MKRIHEHLRKIKNIKNINIKESVEKIKTLPKKKIILSVLGVFVAGIIFLTLLTVYYIFTLPTLDEISRREITESTKIYDRTGNQLLYEVYDEEKRTVISWEEIPDIVKKATISIEDENFYEHQAIDFKAFIRMLFANLTKGFGTQGGSTITQQLAKNAFLTKEKTITRKIKEAILAYRIEKLYSKDEILNLYLNIIPYGQNAYGIEAASQVYFNKHAEDLSLSEASLLAAIPQAPSYYSPWGSHTDELENRRRYVLKQMLKNGHIDEQTREYAATHPPIIKDKPVKAQFALAPHFTIYVQDYLNNKYGEDFVSRSGLKVITTIDSNLQKIANETVKDYADKNTADYGGYNAAMIAEDPKTGQILAMVGSKGFSTKSEPEGCVSGKTCKFEGQFNIVTQGLRQPGSSFKPFVYMQAFIQGFTPDTILFDVPTEFSQKPECSGIPSYSNEDRNCYHPQNYDFTFSGPISMKEALARSLNIPAVKTLHLVGLSDMMKFASELGFTTLKDKDRFGLSLVLGGGEVKMIEMAKAYSVLAADGVIHKQSIILKIEDKNGRTLESYDDESKQVVDPNYPRLINSILSDRNLRSPLFHGSLYLTEVPGYQIALKTGTTNNYVDAWAYGYTPNLVLGVWAGNNDRTSLQKKGGSILAAIPMWHAAMEQMVKIRTSESFIEPSPLSADLPILRGQLDRENIHTILYYLDRLNDGQYPNWEAGVQNWLSSHSITNITTSEPTYSYTPGQESDIFSQNIEFISPINGAFINENTKVMVKINSLNVSRVGLYINNNLVNEGNINNGYYESPSFVNYNSLLNQQNSIRIVITTLDGKTEEREVIVFK